MARSRTLKRKQKRSTRKQKRSTRRQRGGGAGFFDSLFGTSAQPVGPSLESSVEPSATLVNPTKPRLQKLPASRSLPVSPTVSPAVMNTVGLLGAYFKKPTAPIKQTVPTPKLYGVAPSPNLSFSPEKSLNPLAQAQVNREAANAADAAAERKEVNAAAQRNRNARAAKSLRNNLQRKKNNALKAYENSLLDPNNPLLETNVAGFKKREKTSGLGFNANKL